MTLSPDTVSGEARLPEEVAHFRLGTRVISRHEQHAAASGLPGLRREHGGEDSGALVRLERA